MSVSKVILMLSGLLSGATLAKEWDDKCTHLYMKNIEIKAKLLLCLISACHVISLQWLEAVAAQEDTSFNWPAESNYLPPMPHDVTVRKEECEPNLDRSTLFTDLEFWIFDEEQVWLGSLTHCIS